MKRLYCRVGILASLCIAAATSGCGPDPQLVRRSANDPILPPGSTAPILSISSIPNADSGDANKAAAAAPGPAPASGPSIKIALTDPKANQLADIKKAFDKPVDNKSPTPDLTTLKRTVILTIAKGTYRPADRLVNLTVRIRPTNFLFSNLTDFKTEYTSVDVAKLDLNQTNSVSASVSPTFTGSLVGSGQFGVTAGKTLDEQATVSVRPEILNVNVEGRDLVVYREADRGSDLAGNTLIHIVVRAMPPKTVIEFPWVATDVALVSKDGADLPPQPAPNDGDKVSITTDVLKLLRADDFLADVSFQYVKRHVVLGQNTYAEYKQTVEFETGQCSLRGAVVIPAGDVYVPLYAIVSREIGRQIGISDTLTDVNTMRPLYFTDYVTADRMAHWMMRQQALQIGSRRLGFGPGSDLSDIKPYPKLVPMLSNLTPPLRAPRSGTVVCSDPPVVSSAE